MTKQHNVYIPAISYIAFENVEHIAVNYGVYANEKGMEKVMLEYKYYVCKSSWCICINILAEYAEYSDNTSTGETSRTIKIADGLWLRFKKNPDIQDDIYDYVESFIKGLCDGYLSHLIRGLKIVQNQIINNSIYKNTVIIISSLKFSICDFQEEGLIAAIIEWASKMFEFEPPTVNVGFQKENNRYVFDFSGL